MSFRRERAASVEKQLTLRIALDDSKNTTVFLKMDRVAAQDLIDALSENLGRKAAPSGRSAPVWIAGEVSVITDADRQRTADKLARRAP